MRLEGVEVDLDDLVVDRACIRIEEDRLGKSTKIEMKCLNGF